MVDPLPTGERGGSNGHASSISKRSVKRDRRWRWFSNALVIGGLSWLGWILVQAGESLGPGIVEIRVSWIMTLGVLGLCSACLGAYGFSMILTVHSGRDITYLYAARLLFVGQMVRHLPGRFWGLAYQVGETRDVFSAGVVLRANLDYLAISTGFALVCATALLANHRSGSILGASFLIPGFFGLVWLFRHNGVGWVLTHSLPKALRGQWTQAANSVVYPWKELILAMSGFLCSWVLYVAAWGWLAEAIPALGQLDLFALCATYTLAWFVGFVTLLTPSGLGIREATFIASSAALASPSELALLAVFLRVWLLVIDILLFVIFIFVPNEASSNG